MKNCERAKLLKTVNLLPNLVEIVSVTINYHWLLIKILCRSWWKLGFYIPLWVIVQLNWMCNIRLVMNSSILATVLEQSIHWDMGTIKILHVSIDILHVLFTSTFGLIEMQSLKQPNELNETWNQHTEWPTGSCTKSFSSLRYFITPPVNSNLIRNMKLIFFVEQFLFCGFYLSLVSNLNVEHWEWLLKLQWALESWKRLGLWH